MMNDRNIKQLVSKSETAVVEFKRARGVTAAQAGLANRASQAEHKRVPSVPADFWPSYSAFANTDGGAIILGVREKDGKREIEGLVDAQLESAGWAVQSKNQIDLSATRPILRWLSRVMSSRKRSNGARMPSWSRTTIPPAISNQAKPISTSPAASSSLAKSRKSTSSTISSSPPTTPRRRATTPFVR